MWDGLGWGGMGCSLETAGFDRTVWILRVVRAELVLKPRTDHDLGRRGEGAWVADVVPVSMTVLLISTGSNKTRRSFSPSSSSSRLFFLNLSLLLPSKITTESNQTHLQTTLSTLPLSTPALLQHLRHVLPRPYLPTILLNPLDDRGREAAFFRLRPVRRHAQVEEGALPRSCCFRSGRTMRARGAGW